MKKSLLSIALTLFAFAGYSQIQMPAPSPTATVQQKVGLTDISVVYSRPGVKGRTVFGDMIPYGKVWRTGANASTKITFSDNVKLGGKDVPAGEYALYSIPNQNEWTIIIHKNTKLWGAGGYDAKDDLVRFTAKAEAMPMSVESMVIDFGNFKNTSGEMYIIWDKVAVTIPIEVEIESKVMAQIKEKVIDASAPSGNDLAAAANFYHQSGKDLKQALTWMDQACKARPEAFWLLHTKATIQKDLGDKKAAIATAKKSIELAKSNKDGDFGYIKRNEDLIASLSK